jgi:hypothetical protein
LQALLRRNGKQCKQKDGCGKIETKFLKKIPYPHTKAWPKVVTKYIPLSEHHLYRLMCGQKMKKKEKPSCYLMFRKIGLIVWSPSKY